MEDELATEEPMELRVQPPGATKATSWLVTMRTPGHDFELAAGILFSEGIIQAGEDIHRLEYCVEHAGEQEYNVVTARIDRGTFDPLRDLRAIAVTSACGLCGKTSIESLRRRDLPELPRGGPKVRPDLITALPGPMRKTQTGFNRTGGLHAAGLFDLEGRLVSVREDIGRHNAVDKVIGEQLLAGALPLHDHLLLVSGRASFEIVQKGLVAGIPLVAAVGAPSSLAVSLAREFGMTLIGFLKPDRFNVYAGEERLDASA